MTTKKLNQLRGKKATISRQYNKRIQEALASGDNRSANSLKGAKTVQLKKIEKEFA
jgi:hypothetical protein